MAKALTCLSLMCLLPGVARAQASAPPSDAIQIASAVQPLPVEYRASAKVLGYHQGSDKLVTLREGTGEFICLAHNPAEKDFHAACYHKSLEPFMARGRALREQGVKDERVDTVRFAEVKAGKLAMPKQAAMYQLFGGTVDPATGAVTGGHPLFVMYMPGATAASTGLSAKPAEHDPWIMYPGTPKAHIMLAPNP